MPLAESPCLATLVSFDMEQGSGVLETERGEKVKCGVTSFKPGIPEVGKRYRILDAKDYPVVGLRATKIEPLDGAAAAPVVPDAGPFPAELGPALEWLARRGIGVMRSPTGGASADAIGALEARLGVELPASCVEFFRTFHWIETAIVSTLAVESDGPRRSIEEARKIVRAHVDDARKRGDVATDEARRTADALASWIPLAEVGNPLPLGTAIFLDGDGDFRTVDVRSFAFAAPGPAATVGFAELVRRILAGAHGGG